MKHLGLFEGIGGFSLAARWMGWETIAWCEWNEFCQKVLRHHFPEAEGHGDITKTDFKKYANRIDVLTGGFPCQPYSVAGKRKGKEDERHLWPEMLRAIREVQPRWIVGENVPGLLNWERGMVLDEIKADLEAEGFEVFPPLILPACGKNAPHRRDRLWIMAYSRHNTERKAGNSYTDEGCKFTSIHKTGQSRNGSAVFNTGLCNLSQATSNTEGKRINGKFGNDKSEEGENRHGYDEFNCNIVSNSEQQGREGRRGEREGLEPGSWNPWPTVEPTICFGNDGISRELDGITFPKWRNESIKAGGNAIVPQVAFEIFKAIQQYERLKEITPVTGRH